ncbi:putative glutathione-specific gamma-glutamylcyclotransferase 2 [Nomia melanderi]|uniref:putative glutathione-specific gamma-glutamylcyclotransferase 2 n=1 Tax=Nomia melanderi TaxID=2448451 RepID=UPI0013047A43|nr:putative glutathione-specific gamma-glutamylcyclotransferase 2 [Nomia melanderi]
MEDENNGNGGIWVFGYGSLCWHPGFKYKRGVVGHVKGFIRRFWQGNTTHRGTNENPGRVATLIKEQEGIVYGCAFQVEDSVALPYLENRECTLGGYITIVSTFYSRDGSKSFPVIIYIATNKNQHWLGDAPLHHIADQIFQSSGPSGHNVEYLLRLAEFMHRYLPEVCDDHLFTLELLVRSRIKEHNMCLRTLMGNRDFDIVIDNDDVDIDNDDVDIDDDDDDDDDEDDVDVTDVVIDDKSDDNGVTNLRENTFQFILGISRKTSPCLKI